MKQPTLDELTYEWPTNLQQYEAKIFLGFTAVEAIAGGMGFLVPVAILSSLAGFAVGVITAALVLLCVKKWERFGSRSFPAYLLVRWLEPRRRATLDLPLILGERQGMVRIETDEGDVVLVQER